MPTVIDKKGAFTLKAYGGDAKTLLAFNLDEGDARKRLAGFTVRITPKGLAPYYMQNDLTFAHPENHAQDPGFPPTDTINAPIHKFRWVHVPGAAHQGVKPFFGDYLYEVTPRYFDENQSMRALDPALTAAVTIAVGPFAQDRLKLGFTRGFVQSQAFATHFGENRISPPRGTDMFFDTGAIAGTNPQGKTYTYQDQYAWLGFTARERVFEILQQVLDDETLALDVFAYDLREPDFMKALIALGKQKRVRIILDNASLHHSASEPKPEDRFQARFEQEAGAGGLKRAKFGRYSHDKVLIVRNLAAPHAARSVLTGSTNFAITGFYVNSNHVLVFEDTEIASLYARLFDESWASGCDAGKFRDSQLGTDTFAFEDREGLPDFSVTFSPHATKVAATVLDAVIARMNRETQADAGHGSILFAVMELGGAPDPEDTPAEIARKKAKNPVYAAINALHARKDVFSYGISDNPEGIALYRVGSSDGVIVTGQPGPTRLPPPFSQVPGIGGGHQVHHKFVVCGFNGPDPTVFCGSSNLALGGEEDNGDNLLAIRDADVAAAFAIEALSLVDHFNFLDSLAVKKGGDATKPIQGAAGDPAPPVEIRLAIAPPEAANQKGAAAASAKWVLGTTDLWAKKYFDPNDLHCRDRVLFAG